MDPEGIKWKRQILYNFIHMGSKQSKSKLTYREQIIFYQRGRLEEGKMGE